MLDRYPELRREYLRHLARFGSESRAAAHIRCSTTLIRAFMEKNKQFAVHVQEALDEHRGVIEKAIYERAIEGVDEPRFNASGVVGSVKKYSDTLLLAYARRHIKEYREGDVSRTEVNVNGSVKHEHAVDVKQLSLAQRQALRLLLGEQAKDAEVRQITVEEQQP